MVLWIVLGAVGLVLNVVGLIYGTVVLLVVARHGRGDEPDVALALGVQAIGIGAYTPGGSVRFTGHVLAFQCVF